MEVGSRAYLEGNGGHAFIRVRDITPEEISLSSACFIPADLFEELAASYQPVAGEFLLTKDGTPGIAHVLEAQPDGILSGGILRLAMVPDTNSYYVEAVLNSRIGALQAAHFYGGSVIQHWKQSDVLSTMIPRLSEGQEQIVAEYILQARRERKRGLNLLAGARSLVDEALETGVQSEPSRARSQRSPLSESR